MDTRFAGSAYRHFFIWSIFASLAITVCTIIDALLIGNFVGSNGLAVASISTPVFLIYALFGITIGVGANVHMGRALGAADAPEANRLFHSQLGFGLAVGILSMTPLLFKDSFFPFLGVTEELYPLAEEYLGAVMWAAPFFVMYHILSVSVRTDSNPKLSAAASAAVIITNLVLDIIFMMKLGWGMRGASLSLCIAETLGVAVLLTHFMKKRKLLRLRLSVPSISDMGRYIYNGFGMGSANVFSAIVILVFNILLLRSGADFGALYVAIYGVIYTISTIPAAIFDGASYALSTVTSYFAGESDVKGIVTVLKKALIWVITGGSVITLLCITFSEELVFLFGIRQGTDVAATALSVFAASMVFTGINATVTAFWQSIGRAKLAGAMSVIRNFLLMLAVGFIMIPEGTIRGLSATYICTEVICTIAILGVMVFSTSKKYIEEKYGLKGKCFEQVYTIEKNSMAHISADLEKLCDSWEIEMKQAFFINFICEELLLNIIKLGLSDSHKKYCISIRLMENKGEIILRIRDNVKTYNPFESHGDEIDSGVIKVIQKKTKYCEYQRKMIFNYLYMII